MKTIIQYYIGLEHQEVGSIIYQFNQKHGFRFVEKNGEHYYQKGDGFVSGPQMYSYDYTNGVITLQVWIKYAILPGVYAGEMGLDGAFGFALKNSLEKKMKELLTNY